MKLYGIALSMLLVPMMVLGDAGVLVKNGATVIAKDYYAGDIDTINDLVAKEQVKNPTWTYFVYDTKKPDYQAIFAAAIVTPPETDAQKAWKICLAANTIASVTSALALTHCIAKQAGLE